MLLAKNCNDVFEFVGVSRVDTQW